MKKIKRGKAGNYGKWKDGILEEWNVGRTGEPSLPPAKAFYPAKLASWPQPYFIGFCPFLRWPLSWPSCLSSWPENKLKSVANPGDRGRRRGREPAFVRSTMAGRRGGEGFSKKREGDPGIRIALTNLLLTTNPTIFMTHRALAA